MTRICPKCSYIRKETDSCPEWQCPSCQVAYNKAADLHLHTNTQGQSRRTTAQKDTSSPSAAWKWLVLFIVLLLVSLQSYSSWKKTKASRPAAVTQLAQATSTTTDTGKTSNYQQPVITLYGTTWCGYCAAAREFFNANGIVYKDLDVENSNEGYQAYKTLGVNGIPAIVIGGELVEGFDEARIRKKLDPWLHKT
ncbi:glutaredoxin family protein [Undibacterium sp. TJN19]|uniref:glutaredoxin family protein n=1 Tax=Undibacterium sp. TJN19 TaxID=3413055 RepID=UPI003BF27E1F